MSAIVRGRAQGRCPAGAYSCESVNRHGWRRKLKKYLPERLPIGAYAMLGLPLLIAATFVLTGYAIGEHLCRCPLCGQRGTLHFIANVRPAELDAGDQDGPG